MADLLQATVRVTGGKVYAGQCWSSFVFDGTIDGTLALQVIARDLAADAKTKNVTGPVELWANETTGHKGFFVGDTSNLHKDGWTKLATL